jgi:hypothetical protein
VQGFVFAFVASDFGSAIVKNQELEFRVILSQVVILHPQVQVRV